MPTKMVNYEHLKLDRLGPQTPIHAHAYSSLGG